jgi:hypothetical protein
VSHEYDGFRVSYPCWIIVSDDSILEKDGQYFMTSPEQIRFVSLLTNDGIRSVPLFTDEDLAERFVSAAGIEDGTAIAASNSDQLSDFLEMAATGPISTVVFDPAAPTACKRRFATWSNDFKTIKTCFDPITENGARPVSKAAERTCRCHCHDCRRSPCEARFGITLYCSVRPTSSC